MLKSFIILRYYLDNLRVDKKYLNFKIVGNYNHNIHGFLHSHHEKVLVLCEK